MSVGQVHWWCCEHCDCKPKVKDRPVHSFMCGIVSCVEGRRNYP